MERRDRDQNLQRQHTMKIFNAFLIAAVAARHCAPAISGSPSRPTGLVVPDSEKVEKVKKAVKKAVEKKVDDKKAERKAEKKAERQAERKAERKAEKKNKDGKK